MRNAILISLTSLVVGAGLAALVLERHSSEVPAALPAAVGGEAVQGRSTTSMRSVVEGRLGTAERAALFATLAAADLRALESMIVRLEDVPESSNKSFVNAALLARMSEIDPNAAIDFARRANLDAERTLRVALDVVEARGVSRAELDSLLAALPELDERAFTVEALAGKAASDPQGALELARGLRSASLRREALARIGAVWAERDATAALDAAAALADEAERHALRAPALEGLAAVDPLGALAVIEALDEPIMVRVGLAQAAVARLAEQDPRLALEYADRQGGQLGDLARTIALHRWAESDPRAVIAYAESVPRGQRRDAILHSAGSVYGRIDPDGALAWLESLNPAPPGLYETVLSAVAQSDPVRAIDVALAQTGTQPFGRNVSSFYSVIMNSVASGLLSHEQVAQRLLATEAGLVREQGLQILTNVWAQTDPESAVQWAFANREAVGAGGLEGAAQLFAQRDPERAAALTPTVPAEFRATWVAAVAVGRAQVEPEAAAAWVRTFRGEPFYDSAAQSVIPHVVHADPDAAADLFSTLTDAGARQQAASMLGMFWGMEDPDAARAWAIRLEEGAVRDSALIGLLNSAVAPDDALMSAFSSDLAGQQAVAQAVVLIAQRDRGAAEAMIERYIDEPSLREQARGSLDGFRPGALGFAAGMEIRVD